MAISDKKWHWVVGVTAIGTANVDKWQGMVILANFPVVFFVCVFWIREEPATKQPKENSLNLKEDLEKGLLI